MNIKVFGNRFEIEKSRIEAQEPEIREQVSEYLNRGRNSFDLQVSFPESFTGEVMQEISKIEHGKTRTYGDIARELDTSPIAVGQACGRNPVPVIIPCHRVVGKNSLGGYAEGVETKQKLLDFEN